MKITKRQLRRIIQEAGWKATYGFPAEAELEQALANYVEELTNYLETADKFEYRDTNPKDSAMQFVREWFQKNWDDAGFEKERNTKFLKRAGVGGIKESIRRIVAEAIDNEPQIGDRYSMVRPPRSAGSYAPYRQAEVVGFKRGPLGKEVIVKSLSDRSASEFGIPLPAFKKQFRKARMKRR